MYVDTQKGAYRIATLGSFFVGDHSSWPSSFAFHEQCNNDNPWGHIYRIWNNGNPNGSFQGDLIGKDEDLEYICFRYYPSYRITSEGLSSISVNGVWSFGDGGWSGAYQTLGERQQIVGCKRT